MGNTRFKKIGRILAATLFITGAHSSVYASETFRVCADGNNPPFSTKNGDGFENKIAELFANELGQTVEYTWFPQRIGFIRNTLKAKKPNSEEYKCDVVMGVPDNYELTITTQPYYHSTYALIIPANEEWDAVKEPEDLLKLPQEKLSKLKIAMFDRGPGTAWLFKRGLVKQGVPYQTMTGDASVNVTQQMAKDLKEGTIDMAILWGPMAGYIAKSGDAGKALKILPMNSEPGMKFDFSIAMGVRHPDKDRRAKLDELIKSKSAEIKAILEEYRVPLIETKNESD